MTVPNGITLLRFLLIPVFAGALWYYHQSFRDGQPDRIYWWWAVGAFVLAAVSDALDGAIARIFHQKSRLGAMMDPLADKALLVTALIMLSWVETDMARLPIWFVVLVLGRDVLLLLGVTGLHVFVRHVTIRPHWTGKVSTALQMAAVSMVLLKISGEWVHPVVITAGLATLASAAVYLKRGLEAVHASGFDGPPARGRN